MYQNTTNKIQPPKEPLLLESPKSKDFLIDSGAESNIINIPIWIEIQTLQANVSPSKTSSNLATAQGSSLTNYGKNQLLLVPTRTIEQNKLLSKSFKQTFHITDIKHNIVRIPITTKYIPTTNTLNSKLPIKDKHTKMNSSSLTFCQGPNKQPQMFSKFYPIYKQER